MRRQESRQTAEVRVDEVFHAPLADAAQVSHRGGKVVGGQRDRLSVEVSARDDLRGVGEDQRIVGGGVHLTLDNTRHFGQGIAQGAVYLRHAANAVGVLHLFASGV